jgi:hypothetical protein
MISGIMIMATDQWWGAPAYVRAVVWPGTAGARVSGPPGSSINPCVGRLVRLLLVAQAWLQARQCDHCQRGHDGVMTPREPCVAVHMHNLCVTASHSGVGCYGNTCVDSQGLVSGHVGWVHAHPDTRTLGALLQTACQGRSWWCSATDAYMVLACWWAPCMCACMLQPLLC